MTPKNTYFIFFWNKASNPALQKAKGKLLKAAAEAGMQVSDPNAIFIRSIDPRNNYLSAGAVGPNGAAVRRALEEQGLTDFVVVADPGNKMIQATNAAVDYVLTHDDVECWSSDKDASSSERTDEPVPGSALNRVHQVDLAL